MKKTLIALAALAATGAFAQSTVTIYGRLDAGYAATTTSVTAGAVTTEARLNGIQNAGLSTNKWGMKGSEDLGGGMKANFVLEQSMDVVTGAATGFTRDSTVGLSGGFGEVRIGRSYTPLFSTIGSTDVFGTTGASTVNLTPDGARASNAVFYTSPSMSGFSVAAMWGRNDTTSTAVVGSAANTGLSATYAQGPLMVSLAMGSIDTNVANVEAKTNGTALAATYDLGVAKLFGGYTRGKTQASAAVDTYTEATETNLGVAMPMGAITLMAAYGRNTVSQTTNGAAVAAAEASGNDYVLGATYDLSKRTSVYLKSGVYNKLEVTGGDTKTTSTAFGLRHSF